jgi:ribonuclease HI
LKITPPYTNNPSPTPTHPTIKPNQIWTNTMTYLNHAEDNTETIPCPSYAAYKHPKFPKNSYFTDGSFTPPKPEAPDELSDIAGYGIYNKEKNIKIALKLPGLQNILRAELIAIHDTFKITATDIEPTYIFTDNLNSIYLINTHLKHPTSHNNHPDKLLLQEITHHIQNRTVVLYIHKVKAHKDIAGNEEADRLAKIGAKEEDIPITEAHHNAHISPYWLHRAIPKQHGKPSKDPIRNFQKFLKDSELEQQKELATKFTYIDKWVNNKEMDLEDSNDFWDNKLITDSQITQLLKFRTGQYMGNARKHIFYPHLFQNANCILCHTQSIITWPHLLLACPEPTIHKLRIKRHNNTIWELHKLFYSHKTSRCLILINAGQNNNKPQDNTVPSWLLPCTCMRKPCQCRAKLKPDILLVLNHLHDHPPPRTLQHQQ